MADEPTIDHAQALADEPIVRLFSRPAVVRILVALVDAAGDPLPTHDIIENADIGRNAWYDNRELLEEYGLIEQVDTIGNSPRYRARMNGEPVQAFIHLYDALPPGSRS